MRVDTELHALRKSHWFALAACALLLVGVYWEGLRYLVSQWDKEDYNYCYLMPLVIAYLFWEKRQVLRSIPVEASWGGLLLLIAGVLFAFVGELAGEFYTLDISLWLVIVGLHWMILGWPRTRASGFPLLMILTMFPPPNFLYNKISVSLQLLASRLGVAVLEVLGKPAFREGNVIDLGFTQLQVVDACSGLRSIFSLLVLSLLIGHFSNRALWKRAVLLGMAIPVAIVVNAGRIALTGVLYESWGAKAAEGLFHDFTGLAIFIVSMGILLAISWLLNQLPWGRDEAREKPEVGDAREKRDVREAREETQGGTGRGLLRPHFLVPAALLVLTGVGLRTVDSREKTPLRQEFAAFPMTIGTWEGRSQVMEQQFIDTLDFSDYALADYVGSDGKPVNFYVAYYASQTKGKSIHSPETCLPGGGWIFQEGSVVSVPVPGSHRGAIPVKRALIQKGPQRQLSYFWFPQRGRIATNAYQLKLFTMWDGLTRRRTDGALVRLITPLVGDEKVEAAEARLREFTGVIVPVLDGFLPK